jgi:hypothetical protein
VLNIPPAILDVHPDLGSLVWEVYFGLKSHENKYVTKWNAARADLILEYIPMLDEVDIERTLEVSSEPQGDVSYWLMSDVLLFPDFEMAALAGIDIEDVEDPAYALVPVLKSCYGILHKIKLQDLASQNWHRSRHIMVRYFLDAVYHEL